MNSSEIYYPTGGKIIRSVEEFANEFLPNYYNLDYLQPRVKQVIKYINQYQDSGKQKKCLDVGCGIGVSSYHISKQCKNISIDAIDADESSLKIGTKIFKTNDIAYSHIQNDSWASLPDNNYDVVIMLEVIEHLENPGIAISNLCRSLKNGGVLIMSTPYVYAFSLVLDSLKNYLSKMIGIKTKKKLIEEINNREYNPATDYGHVNIFSHVTLATLMKIYSLPVLDFDIVSKSNSPIMKFFKETLVMVFEKK